VLTVVISTAPDDKRAGALTSFFIAGYVGLSLPVVGAGVALLYVSFQVTVLVLGVAVATGILFAFPFLWRLSPPVITARRTRPAVRAHPGADQASTPV
jgi:hypothetical protein